MIQNQPENTTTCFSWFWTIKLWRLKIIRRTLLNISVDFESSNFDDPKSTGEHYQIAMCCYLLLAAATNAPKMLVRWVQEAPKAPSMSRRCSEKAPKAPRMFPEGPPESPKMPSWGPQNTLLGVEAISDLWSLIWPRLSGPSLISDLWSDQDCLGHV